MSEQILIHGNALDILGELDSETFTAIVTDPPYELNFMGRDWDRSGIAFSIDFWKACYRVLRPGGHLLAFSASRTYHRMVCAVEDAGFEIRDQIMWLYGSGMPKGQNVNKLLDKAYGTNEAHLAWTGWNTTLKPAHEPIVIARKPPDGSITNNIVQHNCGALNIDACRIEIDPEIDDPRLGGKGTWGTANAAKNVYAGGYAGVRVGSSELGRYPTNVLHDGSEEVIERFPDRGPIKGESGVKKRDGEPTANQRYIEDGSTDFARTPGLRRTDIGGSPARFFYCAKASKKERGEGNKHPTVKPIALIEYLCKLVSSPTDTLILDPFVGSGTTLLACKNLGYDGVGVELDSGYVEIAQKRLDDFQP